jgi:hypothetical protein
MLPNEDFEREKICYEQNFQHARSINDQMNRVPPLAIMLTGGLWFGAALTSNVDATIRFGLLLFAGICDIALALAIFRIRDVLESYLQKVREFREASYAAGHPTEPKLGKRFGGYSMVTLYASLMLTGSILSFAGAFFFYWPFYFSHWAGLGVLLLVLGGLFWFLIGKRRGSA